MAEGSQAGSIFTTVGVSLDKLRELGQVSKQLKTQLGSLGVSLATVGTKLQDIGKIRYPRGTILDQFGAPIVSKIQATTTAISTFGVRLGQVRAGLAGFGASLGRTLGIAVRWYAAYRIIRGTISAIGNAIKDVKALEMESIFMKPALAAESLASVLQKVSPLAKKWGVDVVKGLRGVQQISRALSDMYEMDLPTALALTDIAMKITVATGQNLNETISNMVGYIRLLRLESVGDIDEFMSTLYAAAYLTNEALTDAGKSVSKAALAMDTLTDAVQRMLPSMVRFGLTQAQIAAIASVFITNLDEAGQGIGAYSAKLFEAIKNNQQLIDVYRDVGVELNRESAQLIPALVAGYKKMTDAQRDVASSATQIGIGAHIVATFWEGLLQIQERSNWVQANTNLLNNKAIEIMSTLQKKQDKLKISMQILTLTAMQQYLDTLKNIVDYGKDVVDTTTWISESLIGAPILAMQTFHREMLKMRDEASKKGFWEQLGFSVAPFKAATRAVRDIFQSEEAAWEQYQERVLGINEALVKDYAETQLKLQAIFRAAQRGEGATPGGELLLEKTKQIMKEWAREVNIATYALGPYASGIAVANAKLEQLTKQLEDLQRIRTEQEGAIGTKQLREWDEAIEKTRYQMEEQRKIVRDINNELTIGHKYRMMEISGLSESTIIQEKLRDLEREKIELREKGLNVSAKQLEIDQLQLEKQEASAREWSNISSRIESQVVTSIKGLIMRTKEWKEVLANIGGAILDMILEKLVHALFVSFSLPFGSSMIRGGVGGQTFTGPNIPGGTAWSPYGTGGEIKDLTTSLPRFAVGGEIPVLAKPGEFVVQNGPSQRYRGLLEAINAGMVIGGKTEHITYEIYANDARSFVQLLYSNKGAIHGIVKEAKRYRISGFREGGD